MVDLRRESLALTTLDHYSASAYSAGYPAAYVCDENVRDSSPYIHSAQDTVSTVSFPHVLQHAKVSPDTARRFPRSGRAEEELHKY